jgi:glycosyltransferase involved in cell wall biosynthesis
MKVCSALVRAAEPSPLRLFVPALDPPVSHPDWVQLAGQYGIPLLENSPHPTFDVTWLPTIRRLRRYDFAGQAVARARAWGAGMIYTWTLQAALLAAWQGLPTILELHDRVTGRFAPWIFRQFLQARTPKRILVITRALRQRLESDFPGLAYANVQIAPNGTNLEAYLDLPDAPTARRRLNLPEGPTVVYTGHFYAGRGMELLYGLACAFPHIRFLWIGGRPEDTAAWRQRLDATRVNNVTLTGFIDNRSLPLYQSAGDILIMPYERAIAGSSGGNSADICSPMKLFDYLAAGRAILSSDLPVFHEVLSTETAVLCPPEDLPAWRAALAGLLADPARCRALGQAARASASQYSWLERETIALRGFTK